jgi:hypothetical protein
MTDPRAVLAALLAWFCAWLMYLWVRRDYRAGVIRTRGGAIHHKRNALQFGYVLFLLSILGLLFVVCGLALFLIGVGLWTPDQTS